ncbi:MAG: Glu-tRNA(Gln) amidotransferase subunit GatE [Candidatus Hydrothermarchaeales archaeon]
MLKIGFEIHQQLDTTKLFCNCPSQLREDEADILVERRLRPTQSELGEIDRAALEEFLKGKSYLYETYSDSNCLVELDEEPPHTPNQEAIDIVLEVALLLNAHPVDEIHFMRKIVIDGSNTSGFQRTAIIAMDGHLDTEEGSVGIPAICLEEEAARKIVEKDSQTVYRLDRLGIPLVEIATAPDITSPEQAQKAALKIGQLLRATGRVKRGLGTIRQDINVSVEGGSRVEIKGVQDLNMIATIIEMEIARQGKLINAKEELVKKSSIEKHFYDVSDVFSDTESKVVSKGMEKGAVLALKLKGFKGFLGILDLGQYAKLTGLKGVMHTDELPAYGISQREVDEVSKKLGIGKNDAFVLAVGERELAERGLKTVWERAEEALQRVPEETRVANADGTSSYMRPLPGAARMYPETDIPPVAVAKEKLLEIEAQLPELLDEKIQRFVKEHRLSSELASQLAKSEQWHFFEQVIKDEDINIAPSIAANTLLGTMKELRREGYDTKGISKEKLKELFSAVGRGRVSKEAIPEVIKTLAEKPTESVETIIGHLGFEVYGEKEIATVVRKLLEEKRDFISERGINAEKPLMGLVMKDVRGRADGKLVSEVLHRELEEFLKK